MVIKDESDRILITHEAGSENGDDARQFLQKLKNSGMTVVSAFSDCSDSYAGAIREVSPDAKFQADHFHTVKNIWKHLKKCLSEYRRNLRREGEKNHVPAPISEIIRFRGLGKTAFPVLSHISQRRRGKCRETFSAPLRLCEIFGVTRFF